MPLAHSLHLIVFTTWDADEDADPETLTYTDGTNARTMYDLLREDPTTRHARLFHNPVPNGGVFDGIRPAGAGNSGTGENRRSAGESLHFTAFG